MSVDVRINAAKPGDKLWVKLDRETARLYHFIGHSQGGALVAQRVPRKGQKVGRPEQISASRVIATE